MLRRMPVRRAVAAADVAAGEAEAQVQPAVARLQALLAAGCARRDRADRVEMRAAHCSTSSVSRETSAVAAARGEQLLVRADLGDAAAVEHDDLVGVADGREPVRDRDRRPPSASCSSASGPRARSGCRAPTSPRRGRGSAGCAGSSARSRSAAARRRRSGSRALRRRCRSRPAARRSGRGSAPPAPPPRSPRRSRRSGRSGGCRARSRGRGTSPG